MHTRFDAEGKPGVTMRTGSSYSTWWNGGLRTTVYFHNMIGLLTETIGNPTPIEIPFVPRQQLPRRRPAVSRSRRRSGTSASRSTTRSRPTARCSTSRRATARTSSSTSSGWGGTRSSAAAATAGRRRRRRVIAAPGCGWRPRGGRRRRRERWRSGRDDVRRSRTAQPSSSRDAAAQPASSATRAATSCPSDQPDFPTATKFVNTLLKTASPCTARRRRSRSAGKSYPAGSYVVKTAQAFRPHVLDMFEPQDHPNDIPYPGGPPTPPVRQRRLDARVSDGRQVRSRSSTASTARSRRSNGLLKPPAGHGDEAATPPATLLIARDQRRVHRRQPAARGRRGRLLVDRRAGDGQAGHVLHCGQAVDVGRSWRRSPRELGVDFEAVADSRAGDAMQAAQASASRSGTSTAARCRRAGRAGCSSSSSSRSRSCIRRRSTPATWRASTTCSSSRRRRRSRRATAAAAAAAAAVASTGGRPTNIPGGVPRACWARITAAKTVPQLKKFLEAGGTIVTIGSSTKLAQPPRPADREPARRAGAERQRARARRARSSTSPARSCASRSTTRRRSPPGCRRQLDVFFDNSPVFRLEPDAALQGRARRSPGSTAAAAAQRLGVGPELLEGGVAVVEATVGKGKLYLFGPEITFRGAAARHVQVPLQRDLPRSDNRERRAGRITAGIRGCQLFTVSG